MVESRYRRSNMPRIISPMILLIMAWLPMEFGLIKFPLQYFAYDLEYKRYIEDIFEHDVPFHSFLEYSAVSSMEDDKAKG